MKKMPLHTFGKLVEQGIFKLRSCKSENGETHVKVDNGKCPECGNHLQMNKEDDIDEKYDMSMCCNKCNWMKPVIVDGESII